MLNNRTAAAVKDEKEKPEETKIRSPTDRRSTSASSRMYLRLELYIIFFIEISTT